MIHYFQKSSESYKVISLPSISWKEVKDDAIDNEIKENIILNIESLWNVKLIKWESEYLNILGFDETLKRLLIFRFTYDFKMINEERWYDSELQSYEHFKWYYKTDEIIKQVNKQLSLNTKCEDYNWWLTKLIVFCYNINESELSCYLNKKENCNDLEIWKIIIPTKSSFLLEKLPLN
jgi:hypothetical protein